MALIDLESSITGVVWEIAAPVGTQVAEDDPVIVLESMKMEIPLLAPADGTVAEILVEKGDQVREGQVVARIEG